MPQPTFGSHLESVRKAARLTQKELAHGIGVSQPQISRLIKDEAEPTIDQVDGLAKLCGVTRWTLIGGTELASKFPKECVVDLDPEAHVKWLGYFASCLTTLTDDERTLLFSEAQVVRETCESIRAYLYEPSNYTDPVRNKDLSAEHVYAVDHAQVSRSHFVVFHARHPSHGAGQELEIALNAGLPVVLLQPAGMKPSRMVLGTYARLLQVHYANERELKRNLEATFPQLVTELVARYQGEAFAPNLLARLPDETFSARLKRLREDMQVDTGTLARTVGVSVPAIENLESGLFSNPSLTTLRLLAKVLRTSVSYLVDGVTQRLEDCDPIVRRSLDNLKRFVHENKLPNDEFQALWDGFWPDFDKHRSAVAEARAEPISADEWAQRYTALKGGRKNGVATQPDLFAE